MNTTLSDHTKSKKQILLRMLQRIFKTYKNVVTEAVIELATTTNM